MASVTAAWSSVVPSAGRVMRLTRHHVELMRRDVPDPIAFCAGEMKYQHADRIHIRPGRPIEGVRW